MNHIDIVFTGIDSSPDLKFIEVENEDGQSISFGTWVDKPNGYKALRIYGFGCAIEKREIDDLAIELCKAWLAGGASLSDWNMELLAAKFKNLAKEFVNNGTV